MSMSDATRLVSPSSSSRSTSSTDSSKWTTFALIIFIFSAIGSGAALFVWKSGWLYSPPLPLATITIEWPQDPLITATARRPLSTHGLTPAPDPRLIEIIPEGALPVRGEEGATPLRVYARPLPPRSITEPRSPMVSLILRGAGIGQLATLEATLRLSPDISFALSPYAREIGRQLDEIREEGHEVFLDIPIMARDQGLEDVGPKALIPAAGEAENLAHLKWSMARVTGYAGLVALPAAGEMVSADLKDLLAKQAETRGLGLIAHAPTEPSSQAVRQEQATIDVVIARDASAATIDSALARLTTRAKNNGSAIGVAVVTPLAIERLRKWSEGLTDQGVRLVPASAILLRSGR